MSKDAATSPTGFQLSVALQRDYKEVARLYDLRQYKPALKAVDRLLKACPADAPHGDTLAYRGLILSALGRKEEGFTAASEGVRHSKLRSAHAWWALGQLHRGGGRAGEAVKALRRAVALVPEGALGAPENQMLARDLAFAQCHARDFRGAAETRARLLQAKPNMPTYWLGVMAAQALSGAPHLAARWLDLYEAVLAPEVHKSNNEARARALPRDAPRPPAGPEPPEAHEAAALRSALAEVEARTAGPLIAYLFSFSRAPLRTSLSPMPCNGCGVARSPLILLSFHRVHPAPGPLITYH